MAFRTPPPSMPFLHEYSPARHPIGSVLEWVPVLLPWHVLSVMQHRGVEYTDSVLYGGAPAGRASLSAHAGGIAAAGGRGMYAKQYDLENKERISERKKRWSGTQEVVKCRRGGEVQEMCRRCGEVHKRKVWLSSV